MSGFSAPLSTEALRTIQAPLTVGERLRIAVQLGTAMLAAGLLLVGLVQKWYGPPAMVEVAELIIAAASLIVAAPIFWSAARGLFVGDPHSNTDQLVALAALAAMVTGDFITATLIPVIMNLGHFFEERSILGAQAAIEGLSQLHAREATVLTAEGERQVDPDALRPGDVLLVRPGDVIAADGEVIDGTTAVDQSTITGESAPEDAAPGSPVYAGTVNLTGLIRVRVTRIGSQTALGRVVDLLREAEQSKTPVQKLIEQYAGYYVPIIITVAAVVLFITRELSPAVAVLVVGCPGALVLAGPTAMVASLAAASRLGILIKNTRFLEALADVDTVVLDKTGTVTLGRLELVGVRTFNGAGENDVLREALACATGSRHPVSRAVVLGAQSAGVELPPRDDVQVSEVSGKGVRAAIDGHIVLLGRRQWLVEEGIDVPPDPQHAGPIVWVGRVTDAAGGRRGEAIGCMLLADVPRPEAKEAIHQLKRLGLVRSILLTGDRREVADAIGQALEMDEVIAEVLPEQKLEVVRGEKAKGNLVMMVGDGVNDALALSSGDVGVALGAVASDIALQSADVALMTNDLGRLPLTVQLARQTRATIHQNILIGAGISIGFVILAAMGYISPLLGAVLHNVGEAFVIINSGRLIGFGRGGKG